MNQYARLRPGQRLVHAAFYPLWPDREPLNRNREAVRGLIVAQLGQEMRARGAVPYLMHWTYAYPESPEVRIQRWRQKLAVTLGAEEELRRAAQGAKIKRGWWLKFRNRGRPVEAQQVTRIRRSA